MASFEEISKCRIKYTMYIEPCSWSGNSGPLGKDLETLRGMDINDLEIRYLDSAGGFGTLYHDEHFQRYHIVPFNILSAKH